MAGFYVWNNVGIALRRLAPVVTLGVGTTCVLLSNGVTPGATCGYAGVSGNGWRLFRFGATHGAFELTAIAVAGGAGLMLRDALLLGRRRAGGVPVPGADRPGDQVRRRRDAVGRGVRLAAARRPRRRGSRTGGGGPMSVPRVPAPRPFPEPRPSGRGLSSAVEGGGGSAPPPRRSLVPTRSSCGTRETRGTRGVAPNLLAGTWRCRRPHGPSPAVGARGTIRGS